MAKPTKQETENLLAQLKEGLEQAQLRENPLVGYGYLCSHVKSIVAAYEGDPQYKFLRHVRK